MFTSIAIYCLILVLCVISIKKKNGRGFDYFDPAFLFMLFVSLTFLPLSILVLFGYEVGDFFPRLNITDMDLYVKTVKAHTVLITSFTAGYLLCAGRSRRTDGFEVSEVWYSNVWINIGFFFIALAILMRFFEPQGFLRYVIFLIGYIADISKIIVIGVILSQFNSKKRLIIFVLIFGVLFMFLSNMNFGRASITEINRGQTFAVILGGMCYADMVKWKGKFFNYRLFVLLIVIALIGLAGAELFESVIISEDDVPSITDVCLDVVLAFEPIVFENAATIISWIDEGRVKLQAGRTYLLALEGFKPIGQRYPSLSEWYVWERNPAYATDGGGYNFSAVAEGYLNARYIGVMIQGFLLSLVAGLVQRIKYSRCLGVYRPFVYAPAVLQILILNRKEMKGIIGTAELVFISVLCLVIVYQIVTKSALCIRRADLVKVPVS